MTDRTMALDRGELPLRPDRINEILNSAEMGIYRIIMRKGEPSTASRFNKAA